MHILIQSTASPKAIPLIAVYLVECFFQRNTPLFQLHMDHGQAVYQNRHIIAVIVSGPVLFPNNVLVDDLEAVVVDVLFINEGNVLAFAGISPEDLNIIFLDAAAFVLNLIVCDGNTRSEKPLPLAVSKGVVVQLFQLSAEVGDQLRLGMDREIFIALFAEEADKFFFQCGLALVTVGTGLDWFIFCHHCVFACLGHNVEIAHGFSSLNVKSLSR